MSPCQRLFIVFPTSSPHGFTEIVRKKLRNSSVELPRAYARRRCTEIPREYTHVASCPRMLDSAQAPSCIGGVFGACMRRFRDQTKAQSVYAIIYNKHTCHTMYIKGRCRVGAVKALISHYRPFASAGKGLACRQRVGCIGERDDQQDKSTGDVE